MKRIFALAAHVPDRARTTNAMKHYAGQLDLGGNDPGLVQHLLPPKGGLKQAGLDVDHE